MWVRFTADYFAGMLSGAGLAMLFLGLAASSDLLTSDFLTTSSVRVAALALLLAGGGIKLRSQWTESSPEVKSPA